MPKPRTEARDQRRLARQLARDRIAAAVEPLIYAIDNMPSPEARQAYCAEVAHFLRLVRPRASTHSSTLARGDGAKIIAGLHDAIEMAKRENGA